MRRMVRNRIFQLDSEFRKVLISELLLELFDLEKSKSEDLAINSVFKCMKLKVVKKNKIRLFAKFIVDGYDKKIGEIAKNLSALSKVNNVKLKVCEKGDRFYTVKILIDTHINFLKNLIEKYFKNINKDKLYITSFNFKNFEDIVLSISKNKISIGKDTRKISYLVDIEIIESGFYKLKVIKNNKQSGDSFLFLIEIEINSDDITYIFENKVISHYGLLIARIKNGKFIEASYNKKLDITNIAELLLENYGVKDFINEISKDRDNFIENLVMNVIIDKNKIRSFVKEIEKKNIKIIEFIRSGGVYLID